MLLVFETDASWSRVPRYCMYMLRCTPYLTVFGDGLSYANVSRADTCVRSVSVCYSTVSFYIRGHLPGGALSPLFSVTGRPAVVHLQ